MPLLSGARLGPYEVTALLGVGGMGEVYRARDTKLGRDVALKVLASALAGDAQYMARFEREARVLASLNHPNVGAIYGLEESGAARALVMELVEGETLADRIGRGPIPLEEALELARQMAAALEYAHEKGIVHRDLKPQNVKITIDGAVKVLDFGLAKVAEPTGPVGGLDDSPTLTLEATRAGQIMGTAAYMAPEQARGAAVDKRADIWAFGAVLLEMLTGKRLFSGETTSDILAAVLRGDIDWSGLPNSTPPGVRLLLRRCVERDRKRRLRDIGDARIELEDALAAPSVSAEAPIPKRATHRLVWLGAGMLLAGMILGAAWLIIRPKPVPAREVRVERITDSVGNEESPAVSPDGKTVAFVAPAGGKRQIWIRLLAAGTPLQLTHDESDHLQPRWSPDSSSLIYYAPSDSATEQGTIWEIPALGGAPHRIASGLGGGDISHDGRYIALFQLRADRIELAVVTRDGSGTERVHQLPAQSVYDLPRWAPNDGMVAFHRGQTGSFDDAILIVPVAGGEPKEIAHGDSLRGLSWLADGSGVVYGSSFGSTVLYPPAFNLRTVRIRDGAERQLTFGEASYVEPDVSSSGKLFATRIRSQSDIWKFPTGGSPTDNARDVVRITRQTGQSQTPSISPDGKELVYLSDSGGHGNLWVVKIDGSAMRQITFERSPAVAIGVPVWSPAGDWIVFIVSRPGNTGEWLVHSDGSGLHQLVADATSAYWSADGHWVYFSPSAQQSFCIDKVAVSGGPAVRVRCENATTTLGVPDTLTLYYATQLRGSSGGWDYEIFKARPENGRAEKLGSVSGSRVPVDPALFSMILSPDEKLLVGPLLDGTTCNLWALPAEGGPMRRLTDFSERSILIARRITWAPDSRHIYAAVAEIDADVVSFVGLL